jgi:hypothetical protein
LKKSDYTAILSVHGIGRHNAHENLGALLETLERAAKRHSSGRSILAAPTVVIEPHRGDQEFADVTAIEVKQLRKGRNGRLGRVKSARIYEVNWSPETRAAVPIWSMLAWLGHLLIKGLFLDRGNWLRRPRLRKARLHASRLDPTKTQKSHPWAILASNYRSFRGSLGRQFRDENDIKESAGFDQFLNFVVQRSGDAYSSCELAAAAEAWRGTELPAERSIARIKGIALSLFLTLSGLSTCLILAMATASNYAAPAWIRLLPMVFGTFVLLILFYMRYAITHIASDIRYWAAIGANEKHADVRRAVLQKTSAMIRHIVADENCTKVVIVCHSLGTTIAYDAICEIGRYNRARINADSALHVPIEKINDLISLGSPIDKIACLFEPDGAKSFRTAVLNEDLRGDLSLPPFFVNKVSAVRWINFWDAADPVSDALFTPLGTAVDGDRFLTANIRNVEVCNSWGYDALGSHIGYLGNSVVSDAIFACAFEDKAGLALDSTAQKEQFKKSRHLSWLWIKSLQWLLPTLFWLLCITQLTSVPKVVWYIIFILFAVPASGFVAVFLRKQVVELSTAWPRLYKWARQCIF